MRISAGVDLTPRHLSVISAPTPLPSAVEDELVYGCLDTAALITLLFPSASLHQWWKDFPPHYQCQNIIVMLFVLIDFALFNHLRHRISETQFTAGVRYLCFYVDVSRI